MGTVERTGEQTPGLSRSQALISMICFPVGIAMMTSTNNFIALLGALVLAHIVGTAINTVVTYSAPANLAEVHRPDSPKLLLSDELNLTVHQDRIAWCILQTIFLAECLIIAGAFLAPETAVFLFAGGAMAILLLANLAATQLNRLCSTRGTAGGAYGDEPTTVARAIGHILITSHQPPALRTDSTVSYLVSACYIGNVIMAAFYATH